jgi:hypothetical protein
MNYTYQLTTRGLCSELNSLLGFYESVLHEDCQVFIDARNSQYFKKVSIYDVFKFPDFFVNEPIDGAQIIPSKQWRKAATRRYKFSIDQQACSNFFTYTDNFQNKLKSKIDKLSLNEEYNCLFIRRGDKVGEALYRWAESQGITESQRFEFEDYFTKINNSAKTIFIFTDDYRCVLEGEEYLRKNNTTHRIVTLTEPKELGHSTDQDLDNNKIHTENDLLRFLAKIEVSKNARQFIGTETSNIYRYLRDQCVNDANFISLD